MKMDCGKLITRLKVTHCLHDILHYFVSRSKVKGVVSSNSRSGYGAERDGGYRSNAPTGTARTAATDGCFPEKPNKLWRFSFV